MIIVGIETSTDVCSVGLARDAVALREERVVERRIHSEKLLSLLEGLLSAEQITPNQISAVAVSIGPGSFTGLRIGLSTAKGLCFALGTPLLAVPTFEVLVEAAAREHQGLDNILVALDAKKGDFYSGAYKKEGQSFRALGPTRLLNETEVRKEILDGSSLLVITDRGDRFQTDSPRKDVLADVHPFCRGDIVATKGFHMAGAKQFADPETCEPTYLKDFVVVGTKPVM